MAKAVYLVATLDTKGVDTAFVRDCLRSFGIDVRVVDAGCLGAPSFAGDVTREEVFQAAGTTLEAMVRGGDRGVAVSKAADGVTAIVAEAFARKELAGVLGLGGSAGTTIATK